MRRVKFQGNGQKQFIEKVLVEINCPSLRGLLQFGFNVPYPTLKNYFCGRRLLPEGLFRDLCYLAKFNVREQNVKFFEENWGKIKGGRRGKV
jgi:hypothetical protein